MTREEAIKDIEETLIPIVGGVSLRMAIEALKEHKTGKWILTEMGDTNLYKCSLCGNKRTCRPPFCDMCGAKMEVDDVRD